MGQILSRSKDFIVGRYSRKRKEISPVKSPQVQSQNLNDVEAKQILEENVDLAVTYLNDIPSPVARPPLRNEVLADNSNKEKVSPPNKKRRSIKDYLDYPILDDISTIEYVKNSKVCI